MSRPAKRLPKERLEKALEATAQAADRRAGSNGQLGGRPVKVVDGSTTQVADTPENQKTYPQPTSQKKGCGFPVIRFVALLSLNSGAILKVMLDSLRSHDLRLFRRLWEHLHQGDIVLGDRAYGEYTTAASLPQQGVDLVARLHHQRKVDFRKAKRLAKNDGLFVWTKGCDQSHILSAKEWRLLPAQITVRIIRFAATIRGFRSRRITLVTTLLDPALYPAEQLIGLYARRWALELCFRDIKSTMGMEYLRCKSPEMAQKELLAYLVAHNLIRCVIAEAMTRYQADLERIKLQRRCGCPAPIQCRYCSSSKPKAAPPTLGRPTAKPSQGFSAPSTQSPGAARGQASAQSLPLAQSTPPPIRGNLPP
jgi:hypothetical protein